MRKTLGLLFDATYTETNNNVAVANDVEAWSER